MMFSRCCGLKPARSSRTCFDSGSLATVSSPSKIQPGVTPRDLASKYRVPREKLREPFSMPERKVGSHPIISANFSCCSPWSFRCCWIRLPILFCSRWEISGSLSALLVDFLGIHSKYLPLRRGRTDTESKFVVFCVKVWSDQNKVQSLDMEPILTLVKGFLASRLRHRVEVCHPASVTETRES